MRSDATVVHWNWTALYKEAQAKGLVEISGQRNGGFPL